MFFVLLLFFTKDLLIGKEFGKPFVVMKSGIRTHISANIGKQCQIICFSENGTRMTAMESKMADTIVYIIREQNEMKLSIKKALTRKGTDTFQIVIGMEALGRLICTVATSSGHLWVSQECNAK